MTSDFSTRLFRIVFALAGCYNLAFGAWVGFWPLHFFEVFEIADPKYPAIWACLGMVVGVYGFLYWHVAWKPAGGRPIVAVGLLGKVLGPIGMVATFSDEWPYRLALLNVYNDLIWWLPFTLFLLRGTEAAKRIIASAPWCCAVLHILGLLAGGLVLRPGTLAEPELVQRGLYIAQNSTLWALGWGTWMLAAVSLVGFYAWWGSKLRASRAAIVAVLLAALGSVFDMSGESVSILYLLERSQGLLEDATVWDQAGFQTQERLSMLLTAGAANLLYTLGGVVLTVWTVGLPQGIRTAMWGTWALGVAMTLAAVANHVGSIVATTAILFPLFIAWTIWMAYCWRPDLDSAGTHRCK